MIWFFFYFNQIMLVDGMNFDKTTPNVIDLDLSDNLIQTFPESTLVILQKLQFLNLTVYQIFSPSGLSLSAIQCLYISRNMISELPVGWSYIEPRFKNVYVTLVPDMPGSQYKCKTPDCFLGESIMQVKLDCKSRAVRYVLISILCGLTAIIFVILVAK